MKPTITLHNIASIELTPIRTITASERTDGEPAFSSRALVVKDSDGDMFCLSLFGDTPDQLRIQNEMFLPAAMPHTHDKAPTEYEDVARRIERQVKADNLAILERRQWILDQHDDNTISVYGPPNELGRIELGRIRCVLVRRDDGGAHTYNTASRFVDGVGHSAGSAPELWRALDILLRNIESFERPQMSTVDSMGVTHYGE